MNSGAKHVVFIRCRDPVDPCRLVHHMLSDMLSTRVHKSRCVYIYMYVELIAINVVVLKESEKVGM